MAKYTVSPNLEQVVESYHSAQKDDVPFLQYVIGTGFFPTLFFVSLYFDVEFIVVCYLILSFVAEISSVTMLHHLTEPRLIEVRVPKIKPDNIVKILERTRTSFTSISFYSLSMILSIGVMLWFGHNIYAALITLVWIFSVYYTWYYQVKMKDLLEAVRLVKEGHVV